MSLFIADVRLPLFRRRTGGCSEDEGDAAGAGTGPGAGKGAGAARRASIGAGAGAGGDGRAAYAEAKEPNGTALLVVGSAALTLECCSGDGSWCASVEMVEEGNPIE